MNFLVPQSLSFAPQYPPLGSVPSGEAESPGYIWGHGIKREKQGGLLTAEDIIRGSTAEHRYPHLLPHPPLTHDRWALGSQSDRRKRLGCFPCKDNPCSPWQRAPPPP